VSFATIAVPGDSSSVLLAGPVDGDFTVTVYGAPALYYGSTSADVTGAGSEVATGPFVRLNDTPVSFRLSSGQSLYASGAIAASACVVVEPAA